MAGWHYQCNGPELGQTAGGGEEQEGLVGCGPWGRKDMTGRLNKLLRVSLNNYFIFFKPDAYSKF